eukprot:2631849-Pyramimonas_sp.AAC.2
MSSLAEACARAGALLVRLKAKELSRHAAAAALLEPLDAHLWCPPPPQIRCGEKKTNNKIISRGEEKTSYYRVRIIRGVERILAVIGAGGPVK